MLKLVRLLTRDNWARATVRGKGKGEGQGNDKGQGVMAMDSGHWQCDRAAAVAAVSQAVAAVVGISRRVTPVRVVTLA